LAELINYNRKMGEEALMGKLAPELMAVILRVNSEYHELFKAILGMLETQGLSFIEGKAVAFLSKMISVINGTR
jgi:hypothetical protein